MRHVRAVGGKKGVTGPKKKKTKKNWESKKPRPSDTRSRRKHGGLGGRVATRKKAKILRKNNRGWGIVASRGDFWEP